MAIFKLNLKLLHKGLILVLLPLVMQLVLFGVLSHLLNRADYELRRLNHAKEIATMLDEFQLGLLSTADDIFQYKLSHVPMLDGGKHGTAEYEAELKKSIQENFEKLPSRLEALGTICETDEEKAAFDETQRAAQKLFLLMFDGMRKVDKNERLTSFSSYQLTQGYVERIREVKLSALKLMDIEMRVESDAPVKEARSREAVMHFIVIGLLLDFLLAAGLAVYFNNDLLARLRVLMTNTGRLAKNQPLLPRTNGGDELAHLDDVFHGMADALNEASEYKRQLISMVSHDLRTPLTSIQTSLALMEVGACGELPERALQEISVAERSASRLINLINDLLDIEKMEAGKMAINVSKHSTRSIVEQSIEAVGAFAEQHEIQFKLPKEEFEVEADGERLVQVLVNLLSNAIKFSPNASTITLNVIQHAADYEFSVADEGPGIPEEAKSSMFQRFKQVDGVKSTKLKGTGLGLAICKAIVEGHDGEIGFDSQVGKGTTFWFRIPRKYSTSLESDRVAETAR